MFPVVIPVAGLGTRSLPASKVVPKEMMCILDKPIIQYIVEEAAASAVQDVIFVSSSGKSVIEDHFDIQPQIEQALRDKGKQDLLKRVEEVSRLVNVQAVRQKEALGLGHAVLQAKNLVQASHFFVMLGDEITDSTPSSLQQLLSVYHQYREQEPDIGVVLLMPVTDKDVHKYGICELDSEARVLSCVEKPKASETKSRMAITGRYLLPRSIFEKIETSQRGALGELQLTDALDALAKESKLRACVFEGTRLDAGDRLGFLESQIHFYLKSELRSEVIKLLGSFR